MFFAKLANDDAVYISNGIQYRHVEDPETLDTLFNLNLGDNTIHVIPNLNALGTQTTLTAAIDAQAVAAELEKWITR